MLEKIKKLIVKAYSNEWFSTASVITAFVLAGQDYFLAGMAFVALHFVGAMVAFNNKPKAAPQPTIVSNVKKSK